MQSGDSGMMRECDTIVCLFNGPKEMEESQGDSRVRGGFRVIPTQFRLQRYSHLEETHENE
jgi:hypothetical protein